ncbi:MAG TPA: hypothetical protein VFS47_08025 [Steroidobacteraceae bacterium]|nr:hypothetical protein [Steroidobacteraceae bacterium]
MQAQKDRTRTVREYIDNPNDPLVDAKANVRRLSALQRITISRTADRGSGTRRSAVLPKRFYLLFRWSKQPQAHEEQDGAEDNGVLGKSAENTEASHVIYDRDSEQC